MRSEMQLVSHDYLVRKLQETGYWSKIHTNQLHSSIRKIVPAIITPGGQSQIISYWDENQQYLCTIHRVITKEGVVIHEDVKDACLNGVRFRVVKTMP